MYLDPLYQLRCKRLRAIKKFAQIYWVFVAIVQATQNIGAQRDSLSSPYHSTSINCTGTVKGPFE